MPDGFAQIPVRSHPVHFCGRHHWIAPRCETAPMPLSGKVFARYLHHTIFGTTPSHFHPATIFRTSVGSQSCPGLPVNPDMRCLRCSATAERILLVFITSSLCPRKGSNMNFARRSLL